MEKISKKYRIKKEPLRNQRFFFDWGGRRGEKELATALSHIEQRFEGFIYGEFILF
jgi:hypothetical protein